VATFAAAGVTFGLGFAAAVGVGLGFDVAGASVGAVRCGESGS
jgi:hypothetical protein